MKNYIFIYITIISVFLNSVSAQKAKIAPANIKMQESKTVPKTIRKTTSADVKIYHVEENINNKFGGHTTTYDVLDSNLINKTDLGPNNTRVITPRVAKEEKIIKEIILEKIPVIESIPIEKNNDYAFVFMIKTYERIAEKGYKSVEMFQKLGNCYFYNSEMEKASRWYCELFEMNTDLESEYYYRYAKSLRSIGENDKASEILEKLNQKTNKQ
jgi:tetratricopeptide (TPR) repeat protein